MRIFATQFRSRTQQTIQGLFFVAILFFAFSLLSSCEKEDKSSDQAIQSINYKPLGKIMPLGASRVKGDRPNYESYRYELWKLLLDDEFSFDFIGTLKDKANYSDYANQVFDKDHEGHGGWKTKDILDNLNFISQVTGPPDIVLWSSPGGNDALLGVNYQQILDNINSIIDSLQEINPEIIIIIEKQAPARTAAMTAQMSQVFANLLIDIQSIAQAQANSFSNVITVDLASGFNDSLIADNIHYNQAGAEFVANRYFEILKELP